MSTAPFPANVSAIWSVRISSLQHTELGPGFGVVDAAAGDHQGPSRIPDDRRGGGDACDVGPLAIDAPDSLLEESGGEEAGLRTDILGQCDRDRPGADRVAA